MRYAIIGGRVFTGERILHDAAVLIDGHEIEGVMPRADVPLDVEVIDRSDCLITPGFIDVQVNGAGGILFNDDPSADAMRLAYEAQKPFGTVYYLPTIITPPLETTLDFCAAYHGAARRGLRSVLGLHLEGPYISREKPGVHDLAYIRPATDAELDKVLDARADMPCLMTVAPESITPAQIGRLVRAGVIVSLGHSNATYAQAMAAFDAGATMATHLYNAMSPFEHRAPGVVGAVLNARDAYAGIIADGFHVDWGAVEVAYRLLGDRLALVTDAMPPLGVPDMRSFKLSDREVFVGEGRCVDANGRLAGADIDLASCVRNCVQHARIPLEDALRMASFSPARALRMDRLGQIKPGYLPSLTLLDDDLVARAIVIEGRYEALSTESA